MDQVLLPIDDWLVFALVGRSADSSCRDIEYGKPWPLLGFVQP